MYHPGAQAAFMLGHPFLGDLYSRGDAPHLPPQLAQLHHPAAAFLPTAAPPTNVMMMPQQSAPHQLLPYAPQGFPPLPPPSTMPLLPFLPHPNNTLFPQQQQQQQLQPPESTWLMPPLQQQAASQQPPVRQQELSPPPPPLPLPPQQQHQHQQLAPPSWPPPLLDPDTARTAGRGGVAPAVTEAAAPPLQPDPDPSLPLPGTDPPPPPLPGPEPSPFTTAALPPPPLPETAPPPLPTAQQQEEPTSLPPLPPTAAAPPPPALRPSLPPSAASPPTPAAAAAAALPACLVAELRALVEERDRDWRGPGGEQPVTLHPGLLRPLYLPYRRLAEAWEVVAFWRQQLGCGGELQPLRGLVLRLHRRAEEQKEEEEGATPSSSAAAATASGRR
ncbi:hypothetical protein Agub_g2648, partial [Astrephomene gubernaculifera]